MFEEDEKYEFDAPQRYDFDTRSTGTCQSSWFERQLESCLPTPQREVKSGQREIRNVYATPKGVSEFTPQSKMKKTTSALRKSFKLLKTNSENPASVGAVVRKSLKLAQFTKHMPAKSLKLTIPDDIEFYTDKRVRPNAVPEEPHSPFKPLSVKVKEFEHQLAKDGSPMSASSKPMKITEPRTPRLLTTGRNRPSRFKTREEEELEELAQVPKFKALEYKPHKSTSATLPVSRLEKKRTHTEPEPFHFVTTDRLGTKSRPQTAPEDRITFRSAHGSDSSRGPLSREHSSSHFQPTAHHPSQASSSYGVQTARDDSSFQKPKMKMPRLGVSTTVPLSPKLATKGRARGSDLRNGVATHQDELLAAQRKAKKFASLPGELHLESVKQPLTITQPQPFRLRTEARGKTHENIMSARLRQEEAEAARLRKRRAQLLPASTDVPIVPPRPQPRPLTLPQPFRLRSEVRHEGYIDELQRDLEQQMYEQRVAAEFKARPVLRAQPFRLHENDTPLTVPEEPRFRTENRAIHRNRFEQTLEEKRRELELEQRQREEQKRLEEEENIRQFRKLANFKATPMPDLSAPPPVIILEKPRLTKPISPKLGRSKRLSRTANL